jgi:hypothetical protein
LIAEAENEKKIQIKGFTKVPKNFFFKQEKNG